MTEREQIEAFLAGACFAVAGASPDRAKYGNKVLRAYLQNGRRAYPLHPQAAEVEGVKAFAGLDALPEIPHGVSIITPPVVTEKIVARAIDLGVRHVWMQPGAESAAAVAAARAAGLNVIAGGPCLLVVLGFREA